MFLLYFLLWVIFNGKITIEICVFGVLIAAAIFGFTCKYMDYSLELEIRMLRNAGRFLHYAAVLVKEIVKANLAVIHMIFTEKEEPVPVLFHFRTKMKTPIGKSLLANAITLTPGTITVKLEDSDYTVHCLDESLAPGSSDSVFVELLSDIENNQ